MARTIRAFGVEMGEEELCGHLRYIERRLKYVRGQITYKEFLDDEARDDWHLP